MKEKTVDKKREIVYFIACQGISKIITYFSLLLLANYFLISVYGRAAFVIAVFNLVTTLTCMGLPFNFIPWYMKKKDTRSVVYFLMILSLAVMIFGLIIAGKHFWILPLVVSIPFVTLQRISRSVLWAEYKAHIAQIFDPIYILIVFFGLILFKGFDKLGIMMAYGIANILISIWLIYITRKKISLMFDRFKIKIKEAWSYMKGGIIATILLASFSILAWSDSVILGFLSSFENVAIYNIAGPISSVIYMIPAALQAFLITRASEIKKKEEYSNLIEKAMKASFVISLFFAILISSLVFYIIKIFFPKYIGAEIYVAILLVGMVAYSIYSMIYTGLISRFGQSQGLLPISIAAVINIVLDILLIPKYGLYGVVFATIIAHLFALTYLMIKSRALLKYILVYPVLGFIILAYYLGLYGILIAVLSLVILYFAKFFSFGDIKDVYRTVVGIFGRSS